MIDSRILRAWGLAAVTGVFGLGTPEARGGLLLSFENTLQGADGETPTTASGIGFGSGIVGRAAILPNDAILRYSSAGNIDSSVGTLDFVVMPDWRGDDGSSHTFLTWGGSGGMIFSKDAANNLRGVFNRFGSGGQPEFEALASVNVSDWRPGQAHYLAYTWNNASKVLSFYLDGRLRGTKTISGSLPAIGASAFQIGGDGGPGNLNGKLDEFRLLDVALTADQVARRYEQLTAAPEPGSLLSVGVGLTGLAGFAGLRRLRERRTAA